MHLDAVRDLSLGSVTEFGWALLSDLNLDNHSSLAHWKALMMDWHSNLGLQMVEC